MMISTLGIYSFTNNTVDAKKTSYASYYHDKFNGRKTASGEVFDNSKLTAAHRTLPFGTEIRVTNLNNGKEVIVTINDRGPFHSSRALDMSRAAFDEIGNTDRGTIPVEFEIVD
jgi:rare lipoprotein A